MGSYLLQSEMVDLFLRLQNHREYLNKSYGTELRVNRNYSQDGSDDEEVGAFVRNLGMERKISSKMPSMSSDKMEPEMKMLTTKCLGNGGRFKCSLDHIANCGCETKKMFQDRFAGTNIKAGFDYDAKHVECFLCREEFETERLHVHYETECKVFHPRLYVPPTNL